MNQKQAQKNIKKIIKDVITPKVKTDVRKSNRPLMELCKRLTTAEIEVFASAMGYTFRTFRKHMYTDKSGPMGEEAAELLQELTNGLITVKMMRG